MPPPTETASGAGAVPPVEAFILDIVGHVDRPHAPLPVRGDISHIPGRTGVVAALLTLAGLHFRGVEFQVDQVRRYGPVSRGQLGSTPYVGVADPALVTAIARNADLEWSSALGWRSILDVDVGAPTVDSPVALDFGTHKELRQLLQPAFGADALRAYQDIAARHFAPEIEAWVRRGRVRFKPESRRMFAHLANQIFVGIDDPRESAELDRAMADFWRGILALVPNRASPTFRRAERGARTVRQMLHRRIDAARSGTGTDVFSGLCRTNDQVSWLDDAALVRMFFGVMSAAFDTTWLGVCSMVYLVARHPEWQDRLRAEARAHAPGGVSMSNLKKLVLHDRVWKESLRLYPVANSLPRRPLRDVVLGGYPIPAGALVLAMLGPSMRDPATWTDPERFDPDRFGPERGEGAANKDAYRPFGAGAHSCIGALLSNLEAVTFLHTLLSRCTVRLERPYAAHHTFRPLGTVSGELDLRLEPVGAPRSG